MNIKVEWKLDFELNMDDRILILILGDGKDGIFWRLEGILEFGAGGHDIRGHEQEGIIDENNGI